MRARSPLQKAREGQPSASRERRRRLTCRVVRPAEDGVEDGPPLARGGTFRVAAVQVPYITLNGVRTGAVSASVVDVHAEQVIEGILLERADGLAE